MKKSTLIVINWMIQILFILIVSIIGLVVAYAQDPRPTDPAFKTVPSASFGVDTRDSSSWLYKGKDYLGWIKLIGHKKAQAKIDSLGYRRVPYTGAHRDVDLDTVSLRTRSIQLVNDTINPAYTEGEIFYDTTKHAASYYNEEADITVNIAREFLIRVYNNSGSTIPNGAVVYPNGSAGGVPSIALADSKYYDRCRIIAVVTHPIENNSWGYVTKFGEVGDMATSGHTSDALLYLGHNGQFSTEFPSHDDFICIIGKVGVVHPTLGTILVDTKTSDYPVDVNLVRGWDNSIQGSEVTISFSDATRTLTVTPTGPDFHNYEDGQKYIMTGPQSVQIPDIEGKHFIYFDAGVLSCVTAPTAEQLGNIVRNKSAVSSIYWDATNNQQIMYGNEMHSINMQGAVQGYLHQTQWTKCIPTGFTLLNLVANNGSSDIYAQFGVDAGIVIDEDIQSSTPVVASTTGLPIYYRTATGDWRRTTRSGFSVLNDGVTGLVQYNKLTTGTWALASHTNNYYGFIHVYGTNDFGNNKILAFMGSGNYASKLTADLGLAGEAASIKSQFPFAEGKHLHSILYSTKSSYANTPKMKIELNYNGGLFYDFRASAEGSVSGVSSASTPFLALTDTPDSYATHANKIVAVTSTELGIDFSPVTISAMGSVSIPTGQTYQINSTPLSGTNIVNTPAGSISAVNVQTALNELDTEKEPNVTKGNLSAGSTKISIGGVGTGAVIGTGASVDVVEGNLTLSNIGGAVTDSQVPNTITLDNITQITNRSHTNLSDKGTNTHAQIDTHITNDADLSITNEIQDLSLLGNTVSLSSDATPIDISLATAVAANTAKITNANHSGDVSGSSVLTLPVVNSNVGTFNNLTVTAKGLVVAGSNAAYLTSEVDGSTTNELNTSMGWNNTTNEINVTDAGGAKTTTITGFLESEVDGSTTNEIQDLSGSGATLSGYIISLSSDGTPVTLPNEADGSTTNELDNANHSGDATGATALTLATVNSNIGTFNNITINAKGLATAGSNVSYAPATGSVNYIQNQYAAAQGAVMWVRSGVFGYNNYTGLPLLVRANGGASAIKIYGRSDNLGFLEFMSNDGTIVLGDIYGATDGLHFDGVATFASTIQATTAKLTNLTNGYIPYHISDAAGLGNSRLLTDGTVVNLGGVLTSANSLYISGARTASAGVTSIRIDETISNATSGGSRNGIVVTASSTNTGAGNIDIVRGVTITTPTLTGLHNTLVGIAINEQTGATNNTNLLLGTVGGLNNPAGNWSIYSSSTNPSYLNGTLNIGTTSGTYKVNIDGTNPIVSISPTTVSQYAGYRVNNGGGVVFLGRESSVGGSLVSGTAAYSGILSIQGTNSLHIATNAAIAATINSSGNTGLGTTNVTEKLTVNGNVRILGSGTNALQFENASFGTRFHYVIPSYSATVAGVNRLDFSVSTETPGVQIIPLTVTGAGNVGIGTTAPTYKLDINGDTRAVNYVSNVVTGTQPYAATSTTLNSNLNADLLDGYHASSFLQSEVDGSTSNELQYLVNNSDATSHTFGINAFGSMKIVEGSNITLTTTGTALDGIVTIAATGGTTNLSISGTGSPLTLNSSTGTDVTITAGTGINLAGTSSSMQIINSLPMTYSAAGIPYSNGSSWSQVFGIDYTLTSGENYKFATSGATYSYLTTNYQPKLTSGVNLATINSSSLLSSTNFTLANISGSLSQAFNASSLTIEAGTYDWTISGSSGTLTFAQYAGNVSMATGVVTASNFALSSDRRLKRNIKPLEAPCVEKIKFVQFDMKADPTHQMRYGVIAQDVERIMPELVNTDANGMKSVNYIDLLIAKVAELENRIKTLDNEK